MTILRSDNFNRSDQAGLGNPSDGGSAWTIDSGTYAIVDNMARSQGSGFHLAWLESGQANVEARLAFPAFPTASNRYGLLLRYVDANNWIFAGLNAATGQVRWHVRTSNSNKVLDDVDIDGVGDGSQLRVVTSGSDFQIYHTPDEGTETLVLSRTEADHISATKQGIGATGIAFSGETPARYDDFEIRSLATPGFRRGRVRIFGMA